MITLFGYIALRACFDDDWSGWLLVIPVFLDFAVIDKVRKDD